MLDTPSPPPSPAPSGAVAPAPAPEPPAGDPSSPLPDATPPPAETTAGSSPFAPCPGETPRAFSAFLAFFDLGHSRSLHAVADQLDESPATVKRWSAKYHWSGRIHAFNSGLLHQQARAQAAARQKEAADWARRSGEYREQEWATAQKLLAAARCFLESFGDRDVEKMTLAQVSRALQISSRIARLALSGSNVPEQPALAPLQLELAAALKKAYAQPLPTPNQTGLATTPNPDGATLPAPANN